MHGIFSKCRPAEIFRRCDRLARWRPHGRGDRKKYICRRDCEPISPLRQSNINRRETRPSSEWGQWKAQEKAEMGVLIDTDMWVRGKRIYKQATRRYKYAVQAKDRREWRGGKVQVSTRCTGIPSDKEPTLSGFSLSPTPAAASIRIKAATEAVEDWGVRHVHIEKVIFMRTWPRNST